jgi:sulfoxide reductase heme-binding subunit YedZ
LTPSREDLVWLERGVVVGALAPALDVGLGAATGTLGADPIAIGLNRLGLTALVLLLASLGMTPLRLVLGKSWPMRLRRTLGLLGAGYAAAHFALYFVLDQGGRLAVVLRDVRERPFVVVGLLALASLVPLVATSGAKAPARLGPRRWRRLHKLAYVASTLGVLHYALRVKKDLTEPVVYGAVLGLLFAVRIVDAVRARRRRGALAHPE